MHFHFPEAKWLSAVLQYSSKCVSANRRAGRQAGRQAGRGRGYRQIALTQNNVEQIIDEISCKIDANRAEVKVHIRALLVESRNGGSLDTGQTARSQEEEECYSLEKGGRGEGEGAQLVPKAKHKVT